MPYARSRWRRGLNLHTISNACRACRYQMNKWDGAGWNGLVSMRQDRFEDYRDSFIRKREEILSSNTVWSCMYLSLQACILKAPDQWSMVQYRPRISMTISCVLVNLHDARWWWWWWRRQRWIQKLPYGRLKPLIELTILRCFVFKTLCTHVLAFGTLGFVQPLS